MTDLVIPSPFMLEWVPKRIVLHWTAGTGRASQNDRKHYHFLIEQDGTLVQGSPKIEANCRSLSGAHAWSHDHPDGYAAHTRSFNSWTIGFSLCGMMGAVEGGDPGNYPLSVAQTEKLVPFLEQTMKLYGLYPTPHRLMTHEEVQRLHGVAQPGKWDIRWLPTPDGVIVGDDVGNWIREAVKARY